MISFLIYQTGKNFQVLQNGHMDWNNCFENNFVIITEFNMCLLYKVGQTFLSTSLGKLVFPNFFPIVTHIEMIHVA
jgi:hypothetical protein